MSKIDRYLEEHLPQAVADLKRLVRQPSVSAQNLGIAETAQLVATMLEEAGVRARLLPTAGGPPVVYGEAPGRSPATLLLYNHYDVQPPEPLELWTTPPFQPEVRGDRVVGRGVSDNKGNIVARLMVLRAFREVTGSLPCGVKLCIEGEEETGSPHLTAFVEKHRSLLRADGCIWEGGGVNYQGRPLLILGVKGILHVELEARGAVRDVHSSWGPVVPNPAWHLVWALATLKDESGRILIPGFYDHVRPPTPQEEAALRALPSEEADIKRDLGLSGFLGGVTGHDFLVRYYLEPALTINGLVSGYTGPGTKTVLPSLARAKLDFRLVPDQRPADVLEKLRRHLAAWGFGDIAIHAEGEGEYPARTPLGSPFVRLVQEAAREVYGKEPVVLPSMAATGPLHPFVATLGLPVCSSGVEHPDSRAHAPDENIRLPDFLLGMKHLAAIMERLGAGGLKK